MSSHEKHPHAPSKGKTTDAANAQNRAQHERHEAEAPHVPHAGRKVGEHRAVDEAALSGVDRPSGHNLDKHTGRERPVDLGRTPLTEAQQSVRRAQGAPDGSQE